MIRIVCSKELRRRQTQLQAPCAGRLVHETPGSVGWTVCAIRSNGRETCGRKRGTCRHRNGAGECHLLISSSAPSASYVYGRFTGRQNTGGRPDGIATVSNLTRDCSKNSTDFF